MDKFRHSPPKAIRTVNWQPFSRRPTWSCVTSRELAKVFGVSLNSINNWKMRELLPPPVQHPKLVGNKNYYRIGTIRAWLENRPEEDIHLEWARKNIFSEIASVEEARYYALHAFETLGIEKPLTY